MARLRLALALGTSSLAAVRAWRTDGSAAAVAAAALDGESAASLLEAQFSLASSSSADASSVGAEAQGRSEFPVPHAVLAGAAILGPQSSNLEPNVRDGSGAAGLRRGRRIRLYNSDQERLEWGPTWQEGNGNFNIGSRKGPLMPDQASQREKEEARFRQESEKPAAVQQDQAWEAALRRQQDLAARQEQKQREEERMRAAKQKEAWEVAHQRQVAWEVARENERKLEEARKQEMAALQEIRLRQAAVQREREREANRKVERERKEAALRREAEMREAAMRLQREKEAPLKTPRQQEGAYFIQPEEEWEDDWEEQPEDEWWKDDWAQDQERSLDRETSLNEKIADVIAGARKMMDRSATPAASQSPKKANAKANPGGGFASAPSASPEMSAREEELEMPVRRATAEKAAAEAGEFGVAPGASEVGRPPRSRAESGYVEAAGARAWAETDAPDAAWQEWITAPSSAGIPDDATARGVDESTRFRRQARPENTKVEMVDEVPVEEWIAAPSGVGIPDDATARGVDESSQFRRQARAVNPKVEIVDKERIAGPGSAGIPDDATARGVDESSQFRRQARAASAKVERVDEVPFEDPVASAEARPGTRNFAHTVEEEEDELTAVSVRNPSTLQSTSVELPTPWAERLFDALLEEELEDGGKVISGDLVDRNGNYMPVLIKVRRAQDPTTATEMAIMSKANGYIDGLLTVLASVRTSQWSFVMFEGVAGQRRLRSIRDLRDPLDNAPLPPEILFPMLMDVLRGVDSIDRAGFVHWRLSQDDIRILPDGRTVIWNFFKATPKPKAGSAVGTKQPFPYHGRGSILYQAPEVEDGAVPRAPSGVWPVGMIFAELALGYHPVSKAIIQNAVHIGHARGEEMRKMVHELIEEEFELRHNRQLMRWEPVFLDLILGMLDKDPEKRWPVSKALTEAKIAARRLVLRLDDDPDDFDDLDDLAE